jgi:hypothetical protein
LVQGILHREELPGHFSHSPASHSSDTVVKTCGSSPSLNRVNFIVMI